MYYNYVTFYQLMHWKMLQCCKKCKFPTISLPHCPIRHTPVSHPASPLPYFPFVMFHSPLIIIMDHRKYTRYSNLSNTFKMVYENIYVFIINVCLIDTHSQLPVFHALSFVASCVMSYSPCLLPI